MITEDYVSHEIAELLEEKGFNEPCFALYNPNGKLIQCGVMLNNTQVGRVEDSYSAPTLQMAMKWLREVHKIDICVCRELDDYGGCYDGYIAVVYSNEVYMVTIRDVVKALSYEEVAELAIKYCLTNII